MYAHADRRFISFAPQGNLVSTVFLKLFMHSHTSHGLVQQSKTRLVFVFLLLAATPVFIWAVMTQRIEIRKRAATAEQVVCWNKVDDPTGANPVWLTSCKGSPISQSEACAQQVIPLTPLEEYLHTTWLENGAAYIPDCGMTPPATHPVSWSTPNVSLLADELTIEVDGKIFKGIPTQLLPASVRSDPGSYNYTTLESMWIENGVEMRLFIYFTSDCTSSLPLRCIRWSVSEVRVYNGKSPGDWFIYTPSDSSFALSLLSAPWGQPVVLPSLELSSSGGGVHVVTFKNLRLQPFLQKTQIPSPTSTQTDCASLSQSQRDQFEFCAKNGYDNICLNATTFSFQGCTKNTFNDCTERNSQALSNMLCAVPPYTPTPTMRSADLNADLHVNLLDFNLLLRSFGRKGNPGFVKADINEDGAVNLFDFNILLQQFGV